jgi:hypothetical protein
MLNTIFSEDDYNSGQGMATTVWGPMIWNTLHIISFNYPISPNQDTKKHYYDYLMSLGKVLPCKACRDNYIGNLKSTKFGMDKLKDRDTFSRYIYTLHNTVNVMLGKKPYMTFEYVRDRYELFRAKCVKDTPLIPKFELGCTKPINNIKTRCIINIVPLEQNQETFIIDKRCVPKKSSKKSSKKGSKKSSKSKTKK